ncbi:pentatricopeptide repeat-containing protein At3g09650, chloroplastic [Brachypodium distachyon]|uniref:Pentacotripeptide-repeat region of PRORP domain-containing protein n=1 Tax=Brachypodium distachyon TaxID=15368 RepID=I1IVA6_BRADI|nr:pentatricopeptide repeat-containing protein At3g09650, chloroplastic [Brachypodium distachyon]KQJ92680.1 hypothetical protein BRADI_4g45220v3 [Brachypodium distachyon]|eukprot:XP_003577175.2 pentatricopeptide repeat-containing protein At3g09650, chloroplastic [Brachypodium distachyon]
MMMLQWHGGKLNLQPQPLPPPAPPPSFFPPSSSSSRAHNHLLHSAISPAPQLSPTHDGDGDENDDALLALLRAGDTDAAYKLFAASPTLPGSPAAASRLLAQLSYTSPRTFPRAADLLRRLRAEGSLGLLDANSLSLAASAAARSGHARLACSLLLSMLRRGLLPDRRAYTAAVSRLSPPSRALRLFDAVLHHLRRTTDAPASSLPDTAAFNAALSACADAGDCRRFRRLFDEMRAWGAAAEPDVVTYNVAIKMCARAGRKDLVARVLPRILAAGLAPDATTFHSIVAAYVGLRDIPAAEAVVQAMRDRRADLCLLLRQLPSSPSSSSDADEHSHVLEDIVVGDDGQGTEKAPLLLPRTYPPDSRVYTTLMKGYMNAGRVDDVVAMARAMRREGETMPASKPDHVTYTTVMSTLVAAGDVGRAHALLDDMAGAGVPASRVTYNVLIKGYCQQLQMSKARELLQEMMSADGGGIEPDVVTYNTLMDGCVLADDSAGALALFNEMRSRGVAPSTASYTTLMKAFAAAGQPRAVQRVFDEMDRDPNAAPDRAAWNMLVEGYCQQGHLESAKAATEKMKERGVQPDVATFGSLAKGVAAARKPGEALVLWGEVKARRDAGELRPDEELLDALADVCVRGAFFKKALEIVACMEENGIAPNKTKYKKIYIEMHSRMFTSKHASQARQDRRRERKRAAEAFKFWLGLPNSYYGSEWRVGPLDSNSEDDDGNYE